MADSVLRITDASRVDAVGRNLRTSMPDWRSRLHIRESVVSHVIELLDRGNCVLLVGRLGVGATSVARSIAYASWPDEHAADSPQLRLATSSGRTAPTVVEVTAADFVQNVFFVHELENKLSLFFSNLVRTKAVLLVDDLHECLDMGNSSSDPHNDVATLMVPHIERGARVLATTTPEGRARLAAKNDRLLQRFIVIEVPEPAADDSAAIFRLHAQRLRAGGTLVSNDAQVMAAELARRYLPGEPVMSSALRLLERAATTHDVNGASLRDATAEELGVLPEFVGGSAFDSRSAQRALEQEVLGQPEAVREVIDALSRYAAGLVEPGRPIASLLLAGPSGVGKTSLALAASRLMTGGDDGVIRVDMSEFADPWAATRLLRDSHESLIGRLEARRAGCLLLDEIDKADASVVRLLLQALGEGRLTSSGGRTVRLDHHIVLLTCNTGSRHWALTDDLERAAALVMADIAGSFPPEFRGRLTRTLVFRPLTPQTAECICERELTRLNDRAGIEDRGIQLRWTAELPRLLAECAISAEHGARRLQSVVGSVVVSPVARWLNAHPSARGGLLTLIPRAREGRLDSLVVDWTDEAIAIALLPN